MSDSKRIGRVVGAMLLLQLAGLMVGFIMLDALRTPDYLATAASQAVRIKAGVLVLMANGLMTIGISIIAWPVLREYSRRMATWLIVLGGVMFLLQVVDNVHIMSMLSLSQEYADGGGSSDVYNALATSTRMTRRWAHYFELMAIDFWLVTLYAMLFRFELVPKFVAGFGIAVVLLQFVSVPMSGFLGYGINTNLAVPLAFGLLANGVWLMWKGFADRSIR